MIRTVPLDQASIEAILRNTVDGMETELVLSSTAIEGIRTSYSAETTAAAERGEFTLRLHDDLPSEMWAASMYESYRYEAQPLHPDGLMV